MSAAGTPLSGADHARRAAELLDGRASTDDLLAAIGHGLLALVAAEEDNSTEIAVIADAVAEQRAAAADA